MFWIVEKTLTVLIDVCVNVIGMVVGTVTEPRSVVVWGTVRIEVIVLTILLMMVAKLVVVMT